MNGCGYIPIKLYSQKPCSWQDLALRLPIPDLDDKILYSDCLQMLLYHLSSPNYSLRIRESCLHLVHGLDWMFIVRDLQGEVEGGHGTRQW